MLAFHEGPSRILISTSNPKRVTAIAEKYEIDAPVVGVTIEKGIEIRQRTITLGSWEIAALKAAYDGALESYVR
jgi:phosphoribosylformylglycinamidine synthase